MSLNKFFILCLLFTMSFLTVFAQPRLAGSIKTTLYVTSGEVDYKKDTVWVTVSTRSVQLTDACWVRIKKGSSKCIIQRGGACATLESIGPRQIGSLIFSPCNENSTNLFRLLDRIQQGLEKKDTVVPAGRVAMLFPVNGERLLSDSLQVLEWVSNSGSGHAQSKKHDWMQGIQTCSYNAKLPDETNTPLQASLCANNTWVQIKKENKENAASFDLAFFEGDKKAMTSFTVADNAAMDSLQLGMQQLENVRFMLKKEDYVLAKALIYIDCQMYTEAVKVYKSALTEHPNSLKIRKSAKILCTNAYILNTR